VLTRWQSGYSAVLVALVACALLILDLADGGFRRWWDGHSLTTDAVSGLLTLLITVLIADQVVRRRQLNARSRAIAAQAAFMLGQAMRSSRAVSAALDGSGDRGDATDEVRTYMVMLMVGAPVLIDANISRVFLEHAQRLGAEMVRALASKASGKADGWSKRLDDATAQLRTTAAPLLALLNTAEQAAATGQDATSPQPPGVADEPA
jgi:hypothetical protein